MTVYDNVGDSDTFTQDVVLISTWCFDIDFTATDGSFSLVTPTTGLWTLGAGWKMLEVGGANGFGINYDFSALTIVDRIVVNYSNGVTSGQLQVKCATYHDNPFIPGTVHEIHTDTRNSGVTTAFDHTYDGTAQYGVLLTLGDTNSSDTGQLSTLTHATIYGTGTNPFGSDNC